MNSFLKFAYELGVRGAIDAVKRDLVTERILHSMRGQAEAKVQAGVGSRLARASGGIAGAVVGATPGLTVATLTGSAMGPVSAVMGGYGGAKAGAGLAELIANPGVRRAILTDMPKDKLLLKYLAGDTPTGKVTRRAGLLGALGLGYLALRD